jgi:hypothetical protein
MSNNHRRLWHGPGTDNFGLIVTDPVVFQIGFDDIGGTMNFIDAFTPPTSSTPTSACPKSVAVRQPHFSAW